MHFHDYAELLKCFEHVHCKKIGWVNACLLCILAQDCAEYMIYSLDRLYFPIFNRLVIEREWYHNNTGRTNFTIVTNFWSWLCYRNGCPDIFWHVRGI